MWQIIGNKFWLSIVGKKIGFSNLIVQKLFVTVTSKKFLLLGFAFKANTNDTREFPAIEISKNL